MKVPPISSPWPTERAGLVNVWPAPERVRFVVEACQAPAPAMPSAKTAYLAPSTVARMLPLVGMAALAVVRGNAGFASLVCCALVVRSDGGFDDLVASLDEIATSAAQVMTSGAVENGLQVPPGWGELIVSGFSQRAARMRTLRVFGDPERMESCDLDRPALLPALHGLTCDVEQPDMADIIKATRAQLERLQGLGRPVQGNRLVFGELNAEGLHFGYRFGVDGPTSNRKPRPAAGGSA